MPTPASSLALRALLDNQVARTDAAFEGLDEATLVAEPGGDCNSIQRIGRHLVRLRWFQLTLLGSDLASQVPDHESIETLDDLRAALATGAALVGRAIADHDPDDWDRIPDPPREGRWGDEPTIRRFVRPFNDFTNHLGGIRAIRRIMGCGNDRTQ